MASFILFMQPNESALSKLQNITTILIVGRQNSNNGTGIFTPNKHMQLGPRYISV